MLRNSIQPISDGETVQVLLSWTLRPFEKLLVLPIAPATVSTSVEISCKQFGMSLQLHVGLCGAGKMYIKELPEITKALGNSLSTGAILYHRHHIQFTFA